MIADFALEHGKAPVEGPRRRRGVGSHQSKRLVEDEWLTDPNFKAKLGTFDLDPCAPVTLPWDMAKQHFTILDNGLNKRWTGRVWLNPPYGQETGKWLARGAEHENCTALIFARTETDAWHRHIWPKATAILFVKGRLWFYRTDGTRGRWDAGAPSAVVAYDMANAAELMTSGIEGKFVFLR